MPGARNQAQLALTALCWPAAARDRACAGGPEGLKTDAGVRLSPLRLDPGFDVSIGASSEVFGSGARAPGMPVAVRDPKACKSSVPFNVLIANAGAAAFAPRPGYPPVIAFSIEDGTRHVAGSARELTASIQAGATVPVHIGIAELTAGDYTLTLALDHLAAVQSGPARIEYTGRLRVRC